MKKFKHLSLVLLASALGLSSCSLLDFITGTSVVSVSVTAPTKNIYDCSAAFELKADVEVKGKAEKTVTWTSSDSKIASVDKKGVVTPKAAGKVEIKATSTHDSSKSGLVKLNILPSGPRSYFIEEGFDYSLSWPEELVNGFTGASVTPVESSTGFYYIEVPEDDENYASVLIYADATLAVYNSILASVEADDLFYFYDDYYSVDAFLDSDLSFELDISTGDLSDEDAEEEDLAFLLAYYHVSDIWGSKTITSDTAWDSAVQEELDAIGASDLPFVALGEEYAVYAEDGFVNIYDYCPVHDLLNGYENALVAKGYEKVVEVEDEEEYVYYKKPYGEFQNLVVQYYFGSGGNNIVIATEAREIDYYPEAAVSAFLTDVLKTNVVVPSYAHTAEAKYKFQATDEGLESAASISITGCVESEFNSYAMDLEAAGFVADFENSISQQFGVSYVSFQYGKVIVECTIQFESREATDAEIEEMLEKAEVYSQYTEEQYEALTPEEKADYDLVFSQYFEYSFTLAFFGEGTFSVFEYDFVAGGLIDIHLDEDLAKKEPGLYVKEESISLVVEDLYILKAYFVDIPVGNLVCSSSDESVATVTNTGYIDAIAEGTTTITLSVEGTEYSTTVEVTVAAKPEASE